MSTTTNALYEGHIELVNTLRDKVMQEAKRNDSNAARDLKDVAMAYATAVDKFVTFHHTTYLDGSAPGARR